MKKNINKNKNLIKHIKFLQFEKEKKIATFQQL